MVACCRKLGFTVLAVATLFAAASSALGAERRIALVIGIAQYANIPALKNTVNDMRLISERLGQLEFEVFATENPDLKTLRKKIDEFAFQAETADVAMVYYAGHGVEIAGVNYLVPTDISAENRQEIAAGSVSLDRLLLAVDKARQLRIVVLDSCRNDPFVNPDGTSQVEVTDASVRSAGLAPASPNRGTLVAYAAEAGAVAADGEGANSPFARALAKHLGTADLEIGLTFRRVRDSVLAATGNTQVPYTYGSLPGNPYFLSGGNQKANSLAKTERRNAWASLAPAQEEQLAALARDGDTRAMAGLAYMRLNPDDGAYDPLRAIRLLNRAADAGDAEARYELGKLFEKGIGTQQDTARALELYNLAAEDGYADAINDLGFLYFQGAMGLAKDKKRAISLFGRAADLRHPQAMFNFAALIDDGLVAGKKPQDAALYLYNALRAGADDVLAQLSQNPRMFKPATRKALQRQLASVSFYAGAIDGDFGPGTTRSMKRAFGIREP